MNDPIAPSKTSYVLGFMFNEARDSVVLIQKAKPDWQRGYLNGVGGKIEAQDGYVILNAMTREFYEETGVTTAWWEWYPFAVMEGKDWLVHCLKGFNEENYQRAETKTEEVIVKANVLELQNYLTLSNVPWLVHMALDSNMGNTPFQAHIHY